MIDRTSTDLAVIRRTPRLFTWGAVQKIHDVDGYALIEAIDKNGETTFHVYVDGEDQRTGTRTFDGGLVLAISIKNNGSSQYGHSMAQAACKVLGVKDL